MTTPHSIWTLCQDCAANIYGHTAPTAAYADRTARLLFGTACTESRFQARRQVGDAFHWETTYGAWGLWQTESAAVQDSLKYLQRRPALRDRAAQWLWRQRDANISAFYGYTPLHLLQIISGWDRLAVLFCRLHYLRRPEPIPATLCAQAAYYKQFYNTIAGSGSVRKYVNDWNTMAAPVIMEARKP